MRWQPADQRRMVADAWRFVPEGHRRKLAGGKPAAAGAAPGCHADFGMPQRGIGECFGAVRPAAPPPSPVASGRSGRRGPAGIPGNFFDAPLGHEGTRHGIRGRRPLARPCPRLISSGVPLGREPGGHALTQGNDRCMTCVSNSFGCGSAALYYNSAESSRAAWILPWHRRANPPAADLSRSIPLPQIPLPNAAAVTNRCVPPATLGVGRARVGPSPRLLPALRSFRSLRCSTPRHHNRSVS